MRILITQRELIQHTGSELFAVEVSNELSKRGHQVAIYSPRIGDVARLVYGAGVKVKSRIEDLPWEPEIIHGQHHLQAMAAMAYFDNAPGVYFCHGAKPWVENAPLHPRMQRYLVNCVWMALRVEAEFGIERNRIEVIPNFVNLARFSETRTPSAQSRRALLFHGAGLPDAELQMLERACGDAGLSLDKIGGAFGNPQTRPEVFLPEYDLVFAIGRSAIEAMACGCAVIPILPGLAGSMIDSGNFAQWAHSNFSPRYFTSAKRISTAWLEAELKHYDPNEILAVSAKVRREHGLDTAVTALENVYKNAISRFAETPYERRAEFSRYLERLSQEADALWLQAAAFQQIELQNRSAPLPRVTHTLRPLAARLTSKWLSWTRALSSRARAAILPKH